MTSRSDLVVAIDLGSNCEKRSSKQQEHHIEPPIMKLVPGALALTRTGFQLLMIGRRRQDLTPAQYRDHYENVHIPLMRNLTGDSFPLSHERHYISRMPGDHGTFPADLLLPGIVTQADFDFDAVAVLTYRDRAHFDANWAYFEDEEFREIIAADEAKFSEWVKGVFLSGYAVSFGEVH
ncbi:uncharacterized protein LTR77_005425 [Saxophila tyrrhenica]|uniref:EthD domain-containing protein n=1 Tax=Saxophila tyrrhenica TaxID=1690608 RepID=A0AAV9PBX2_9PEZI|nr:hypothetical protein LTR77_005425 [Saxophila tyrrhenica]